MNIRVISEEREFLALKKDWDRLAQNLAVVTKFDWIYRWWGYFKKGNELNILVAQENDKVIGIAPLYLENTKAFKFIPFKSICFLGGDVSDLLDFLVEERPDREMIFKALLDYMLKNFSFDLLEPPGLTRSPELENGIML